MVSLAELLGFAICGEGDDDGKTVIYECTRSQMKSKRTVYARMEGLGGDHYFHFWLDFQMQSDSER